MRELINEKIYELSYIEELLDSDTKLSEAGRQHLNKFRLDVYEDYKRVRHVTTRNSCRKVGIDDLVEKLNPFILHKYLNMSEDNARLIIKYTKIFFGKLVK